MYVCAYFRCLAMVLEALFSFLYKYRCREGKVCPAADSFFFFLCIGVMESYVSILISTGERMSLLIL